MMLYSPLHLTWAGGEAVLVFFVLSGLVLALPAASGKRVEWRSYYPSRLVRLYLPIILAVIFAFVLIQLVPRHPGARSSWWLAGHVSPVGLHEAAHDAAVVRGTTGLNSALWSLQWEVIFSVLLPLFIVSLVRVRTLPALKVTLLMALALFGSQSVHRSLLYLPVFGLGVVMAQQMSRLDGWGFAFDNLQLPLRRLIMAGTAMLLISSWWLAPVTSLPGRSRLSLALTMVGACMVVWLFASTREAKAIATTPVIHWLGKRSFSLYLVHEPIVVTVAYLLGATRDAALVLVIALPLSLLVTEVFGRLCEVPSHRLAQRVGARFRPPAKALLA